MRKIKVANIDDQALYPSPSTPSMLIRRQPGMSAKRKVIYAVVGIIVVGLMVSNLVVQLT